MQAVVYTKPFCPYCTRAVVTLERAGFEVVQIAASGDETLTAEMVSKANGRTTFPQVFINDRHIGGSDEVAIEFGQG